MAPLWPGLQGAVVVGTALVFPVSSQEVLRMRMSWPWEQLLGTLQTCPTSFSESGVEEPPSSQEI